MSLFTNYLKKALGMNDFDILLCKMQKLNIEHSPSKDNCFICFNGSRLKAMKDVFYFFLKDLFTLDLFKFLS